MKSIAVLLCVLAASCAVSSVEVTPKIWNSFKLAYNKTYISEAEEKLRMKIYAENLEMIAKHNEAFARGEFLFRLQDNQFGDLTLQEFVDSVNGFNRTDTQEQGASRKRRALGDTPNFGQLPAEMDWRKKGAVTEVKNQGDCGSCWSFSATGSLEAQNFLFTDKLVSLSEQNLIDCSGSFGTKGCKGGFMDDAFKYIRSNGGINTEESYPYEASEGKCRYDSKNSGAKITDSNQILSDDEADLKEAVAKIGPMSVAIDANHKSLQFYKDGVYYEPACSSSKLSHAVLVIGYGSDLVGGDYWLVKNSWGTKWGIDGYIKMARNRNNNCGIASYVVFPIV